VFEGNLRGLRQKREAYVELLHQNCHDEVQQNEVRHAKEDGEDDVAHVLLSACTNTLAGVGVRELVPQNCHSMHCASVPRATTHTPTLQ